MILSGGADLFGPETFRHTDQWIVFPQRYAVMVLSGYCSEFPDIILDIDRFPQRPAVMVPSGYCSEFPDTVLDTYTILYYTILYYKLVVGTFIGIRNLENWNSM